MIKHIKAILGQCCPRCGEPLPWKTVQRLVGQEHEAPEIVPCQHCNTRLRVRGNGLDHFVKLFLVFFVPAAIVASVWAPWAGIALNLLFMPFIARIIGIEEAL